MKLCKDCKHFRPGGVAQKIAWAPSCYAPTSPPVFDPVTGTELSYMGDPYVLRSEDGTCGPTGKWFEPANLDGKLAMLEDTCAPDTTN